MRPQCFLALAMLAACNAPEPAADNVAAPANDSAPAAEPAPPAPDANQAAAEPAVAPAPPTTGALPQPFHGTYDASRAACAAPSEYRLRVTGDELRFHESIGKVRTVAVENPRRLSVVADYQGEGESWRSTRRLELSEDGGTLTISGDGTSLVRIRCP